jgi:hypothetical protein
VTESEHAESEEISQEHQQLQRHIAMMVSQLHSNQPHLLIKSIKTLIYGESSVRQEACIALVDITYVSTPMGKYPLE